jgi:hypothetical protein
MQRQAIVSWTKLMVCGDGFSHISIFYLLNTPRLLPVLWIDSFIHCLQPRPSITLVGVDPALAEIAREYGCHVTAEIDVNFMKSPLAGASIDAAVGFLTGSMC